MICSMKRPLATVVIAALASSAHAEPFTYQGSLMEAGVPANGSYDMVFQLADAASGGFALAADTVNNVSVVDGVFTVEIDFPSSLMNSSSRWLAITVEGTPLTPRVRMRETPRALNAVRANTAGSIETPFSVVDSSSTVFEVISTSSTGTAILGEHSSTSGTTPGIHGVSESGSTNAVGVLGEITDTSPGGLSAGVRGRNRGQSSLGIGVYGSHDAGGWGVYGTAPTGRGVVGISSSGTGLYAQTNSGAQALQALNNDADSEAFLATEFTGVVGRNLDTAFGSGVGVLGDGGRYGVQGIAKENTFSGSLVGVFGEAGTSTSGPDQVFGVYGRAVGSSGFTQSTTCYGIWSSAEIARSSDTAYGIYAQVFGNGSGGPNAYAGYFSGDVHVAGTLSKSSGSFKIDHPLEPETKYLSHSFMESPEMMNVYSGVVVLDGQGRGIVELPDYFETLNRDFRYQLTAIGGAMPGLHVASEIQKNSFAIAGGMAGLKVSWEVSGVRQDPSALYHPIVVEEDKSEQHRGKYLDPEAYGFGNERAIHPSPNLEEN